MSSSKGVSRFFRGGSVDETRRFAQRLNEFKSEGCCILVTGNADNKAFNRQLRKSLGESSRKQIIVATDTTEPERILGPDISDSKSSVEVIKQPVRSVSTASTSQLDRLSNEILNVVHRFDNAFGLSDNDLRIGVEELNQLSDQVDRQTVIRFIRSLTQTIEFVNGTAYCQFRGSTERAEYLIDSGLFDARIEVRNDRQGEERWHLPEDDITTDWVEI